jgi:hypothetical protein
VQVTITKEWESQKIEEDTECRKDDEIKRERKQERKFIG